MADTEGPKRELVLRLSLPRAEVAIFALILVAAFALRFWDLGSRALHHDESLHATYSWYITEGRGYQHLPMMHGPFKFFGAALVFFFLGDSDYTSRVLPALFGTALAALPFLLRQHLGRAGAMAAAFFLAFSPSFVYFSRFLRDDIFIAFWTLALAILWWRYEAEGKDLYLYLAAAVLAFSFTTMETTYLTLAIFGVFLLFLNAGEVLRALGKKADFSRLSRSAAFALLLATLALPQLAAFSLIPLRWLSIELSRPMHLPGSSLGDVGLALGVILALLLASAFFGLRWRPRVWLLSALIFYAIYGLLYSSFFTNLPGLFSGLWGSLDYWLLQQGVRRGGQPWYYYLMLLTVYEFLTLALGLAAAIYFSRKGDLFSSFLVFWAGLSLVLYSSAGEKMPWLVLHLALPLAILAARFAGQLWEGYAGKMRLAVVIPLLVLFPLSFKVAWQASFTYGDIPREMLIYTQTSPDVPVLRDEMERLARETGLGKNLPVTVDAAEGFSWPWAWYLRDYKFVGYPDLGFSSSKPSGQAVFVSLGNDGKVGPSLEGYGPGRRFKLRWWFPEDYRGFRLAQLPSILTSGEKWSKGLRYFFYREPPSALGSSDAVAYFPEGFALAPLPASP